MAENRGDPETVSVLLKALYYIIIICQVLIEKQLCILHGLLPWSRPLWAAGQKGICNPQQPRLSLGQGEAAGMICDTAAGNGPYGTWLPCRGPGRDPVTVSDCVYIVYIESSSKLVLT